MALHHLKILNFLKYELATLRKFSSATISTFLFHNTTKSSYKTRLKVQNITLENNDGFYLLVKVGNLLDFLHVSYSNCIISTLKGAFLRRTYNREQFYCKYIHGCEIQGMSTSISIAVMFRRRN